MTQLIIILILIISVLLILAVMAQSSKGTGLAGNLGASAATQIMGAKRTTDFLERVTWVFASAIMVLALLANITLDRSSESRSPNIDAAKNKQIKTPVPSNNNPAPAPGSVSPSTQETNTQTDSTKK
ncbi:MAG: preprotein translocase subunit SecG [Cytophagales bacterium]|nr:preprotein translocase subunit SecG [Bernardetiaceae bacterium]MDW8203784.1 preprotein translocase subunit SecG [Cytophagales bacterium]